MPLNDEMELKYIVLKVGDIHKHSSASNKVSLQQSILEIEDGRASEGKRRNNTYLVINSDEPYANEIIEILKRNGHWGEST